MLLKPLHIYTTCSQCSAVPFSPNSLSSPLWWVTVYFNYMQVCQPEPQTQSLLMRQSKQQIVTTHWARPSLGCRHPFHLNDWRLSCHQCQLWEKFTCLLTEKSLSSKGHAYHPASKPGVLGRPDCPRFKCIPLKQDYPSWRTEVMRRDTAWGKEKEA